ncbi:acyltransferase family protein [Morganella morganii]|uniref:acyltransferase family protein n=1 Tax=Morganella morganii TaxID=582 RepID=UPI001299637B|nr:acyltransferase family protein [Morganella morganii]MRE58342.1 acyltransferase family protein [Morganella morganii]HDU8645586.1 acyltransferase [Morganella morganii subsp. morganii]
MQKKSFREDINGLRAIAVLSVLLFHFKSSYLPGGFAGVDVFFVISGFLMTSIIFRGIENNTFSIIEFLKSRAKRIIPALAFVVAIVLAIGYLIFDPSLYRTVGKHAVASLLFISNIIYNRESGYFDIDSHDKLFLHTWSLSVEWQFYIIYPIALIILSKFLTIESLKKAVWVSFFVFLSISIYESSIDKSSSYFLLYSRAWELLIGGIAYIYPLKNKIIHEKFIEIIGLILIITSLFLFSETTEWPSYNALLPAVGTYLCIVANNKNSILSFRPIQEIGLLSYSIYLFHWPILVISNKLDFNLNILSFLVITISLSLISYNFIEKKRNYSSVSLLAYISIIIFSYVIFKSGLPARTNGEDTVDFHSKYYGGVGIPDNSKAIRFNENKEVEFILVGDSLSRQYANYLNDNGIGFVGIFSNGCFSMNGYYDVYTEKLRDRCISRYKNLKEAIGKYKNADIIIAQRWDDKINLKSIESSTPVDKSKIIYFIESYLLDISASAGKNNNVYILSLAQGTNRNTFECQQKSKLPIYSIIEKPNCSAPEKKKEMIINTKIQNIVKKMKNSYFIDINDFICDTNECNVVDNEDQPIYSDNRHLSLFGAEYIGDRILKLINDIESNK